ncbi:MAG TPA: matrixin family metalloprotease [Acidimicrobiia bacterium]|nr:matrixin family metalloprotease [Acidimicrobiia bacterium]
MRRSAGNVATVVVVVGMIAGAIELHAWLQNPQAAPALARSFLQHPHPAAVAVARGGPTPPVAGPAEDPAGYKFLQVDARTGQPVRFNPCGQVEYVVNPTGAPPGGLTAVNEAIARLSEATGIELVAGGLTSETPSVQRGNYQPYRYGDRWAPVLVGWLPLGRPAGPEHGLAGVGGPGPAVRDGGTWVYVTGDVTLNSDADVPASDLTGVLMHELGHVLGLDHSTGTDEIMFPGGGAGRAAWGQGDLAGLQKVGRPAGCLPEPKP